MKQTGGQALVGQLLREGVVDLFGIPGVQLDWAVDALCEAQDQIRFVVPRHEQTASYMADGYARSSGREGVCMVVPGPGVLNALSGVATAYACSSRMLFLAGQIPSDAIGRGHGMLHEIPDQSGVLKSLTKWSALARSPEEVPELVHEAFVQLRSGMPRPVALEIPPDVLQAAGEVVLQDAAPVDPGKVDPTRLAQAAELLRQARFPVIQAGGGAAAASAAAALRELAERLQAPVVMTDGARGLLPSSHPLALTALGGRAVFPHADVVLVAGSRFVDALARPTWAGETTKFIYLNLDPAHAGAPRTPGVALTADVRTGLEALHRRLADVGPRPSAAEATAKVKAWCAGQIRAIQPQSSYVDALHAALPEDAAVVSELTQVGYFSNVALPVEQPRSFITPGFQGTLGYGFPTALGVAAADAERRVVSLTGDGGFGWGMQELATAVRYGLNLTVVVFADGRYGNVQRIQRRTFGREFATELVNPDFQLLAKAFGVPSQRVTSPEDFETALRATAQSKGPAMIEVQVGEMPSPWALIHAFVPPVEPPPPNPLGEPGARLVTA